MSRAAYDRTLRPRIEPLEDRRLLSIDPFPVPLVAMEPPGSLIYDGATGGEIVAAGEIYDFTIDLDDDQTVALVVDPGPSLRPTVELLGPGGSLGGDTADAAGEDAVLQAVATDGAGTYTIRVGGGAFTTGTYSVQLVLNAAVEEESHDAPTDNDSAANAQDLQASFIAIGDAEARRGAVRGDLAGSADWYRFSLEAGRTVTLALEKPTPGDVNLALYDGAENLLADGVTTDDLDRVIQDYLSQETGAYFAQVTGTDGQYSLLVTHGATFESLVPSQQTGLVSHWPLDEGLGTTVTDAAGGNHGYIAGAHWTAGVSGSALVFDGFDDYVGLGNPASLQILGEITLAAWIKPEATDGLRSILDHGHATSPNGQVYLRFSDGMYEIGSWNGSAHRARFAIPAEDVGSWVHLAGTYDGFAWRLYRNGVEVAVNASTTGPVWVNQNWAIGAHGTGTQRFFQGAIDDPRVYNRALSPEEVDHLYQNDGWVPPQDLTAAGSVLGFLADGLVPDDYSIDVRAGDVITATTFTPAGGPGEFGNDLDPMLWLMDPNGVLVATDGDGADGRNALIAYPAAVGGTYTVRIGSVGDTHGEYVLSALADEEVLAFPVPLQPQNPLGSLVYDSSVAGTIAIPGDLDPATIALDDDQTITVVVRPDGMLRPSVELSGPGGAVIDGTTAGAAGEAAVLQLAHTTGPGQYTVTVGGELGTTGPYTIQLILNAAVETETYLGPANNESTSAQGLDDAIIPLGIGPGERGAVLGTLSDEHGVAFEPTDHLDIGNPNIIGSYSYDPVTKVHSVTGAGDDIWFTRDQFHYAYVPITGDVEITARVLGFEDPNGLHDWAKGGVMVRETLTGGSRHASIFLAPGHGVSFQSRQNTSGSSTANTPAPEEVAPYWVKLVRLGNLFSGYQSADGSPGSWTLIGSTTVAMAADAYVGLAVTAHEESGHLCTVEFDHVQIMTGPETLPRDWYEWTMEAEQTATLALTTLTPGQATLELYDDASNLLAIGTPAGNLDQVIGNFVAPDTGSYYARVLGKDADYSLVVTRQAGFDTEPNDDPQTAQETAATGAMLGYLSGTAPGQSSSSGGAAPVGEGMDTGSGAATAGQLSAAENDYLPNRLIVRFSEEATEQQKSDLLAAYDGTVVGELPLINAVVVKLLDPQTDVLYSATKWSANASVVYAEPDYLVHTMDTFPDDPMFSDLWGMHNTGQLGGTIDADIDAPEAWDLFTGSSEVVIASIDTGIDYNHEDLAPNMWTNPGEIPGDGLDNDGNGYIDDVYGIDAYNGDSDPWDDGAHGSHTAGTFGGVGNNGIGVAGVNWSVQIMALKFLSSFGSGSTSAAIECVEYMTMMKTDYGVNVVVSNNSWGGGGYSQALYDAIQASNDAGIMFAAAAGNSGSNNDVTPEYPGAYNLDGIIAVAATDPDDNIATYGDFGSPFNSSYGATTVDLGAPGVAVLSATPNNTYSTYYGTSMATPHVAGAVAMLAAQSPEATLAEIKAAIMDTTDPLPALDGLIVTGGRLNLARALAAIGDPGDYYAIEVDAGNTLLITTSTPGDGAHEFENLLDPIVELYGPDGLLLAANDNGAPDGRNAELTYDADAGGTYTVRVLSAAEKGPYVLSVSGNTGGPGSFAVAATDPADDELLGASPPTLTVYFNDTLLLGSLDAADLSVGALTAESIVEVPDGNTVVFGLPALAEGTHEVTIAAGAILDVQGTPIDAYSGQLAIDLTGPRVIDSSLTDGDVLNVGALVYTAYFDEELSQLLGLGPEDATLVGVLGGEQVADVFEYDPLEGSLRLEFADLPEDNYLLTLHSGDGAFEDLVGNDLDGDTTAWPIPPNTSGDGTPGGDFVLRFSVDAGVREANAFTRLEPLGGLMFTSADNRGLINEPTDQDGYSFFVEAGQTVTAHVVPDEVGATMTVELIGLAGPISAPGAGRPAVLPLTALAVGGTYEIRISADVPTTYGLQIDLNLVREIPGNDTADGSELAIDPSFVSLGSGRYGVLGTSQTDAASLDYVVWGVQPATGQIVLTDPASGHVLFQFDAPGGLSPADTQIGLSIAEGGNSLLYVNADVDPTRLYRLDPLTGAILSVETTDGLDYDGLGFEWGNTADGVLYSADMTTDPGWTLEGEWAYGIPTGQDGDPVSGYTGSNVIGYNLNGAYPNNLPAYYATMPAIDASDYSGVTLSFYRWLGIESSSWDHASVEVSNNGTTWTKIWDHDGGSFTDGTWVYQSFDISAIADGQPTVYVRWSMGPTDSSVTYCGWNIDEVRLSGNMTLPPKVFLNHDSVEIRRQDGYSGNEVSHFAAATPSGAVGGDDTGRQFVSVPGMGIVEYDPDVPDTILNTLPEPEPGSAVEGLAFDGINLYASTVSGMLFTLDPDSGAVLAEAAVAGGPLFGLGAAASGFGPSGVYFSDFEEDNGGWIPTADWDPVGDWEWGIPTSGPGQAFSGQKVWATKLAGLHSDAGGFSYLSQTFDLTGQSGLELSWQQWVEVNYDFDTAKTYVNGDEVYQRTTANPTSGYEQIVVDLSPYDDMSSVEVVFELYATDVVSLQGWYIDDVWISPPDASSTGQTPSNPFGTQAANAAAGTLILPDVDEYEVDLTGKAGHVIDVILAGQDSSDFSTARLDLLDVDGSTVLATSLADPMGVPAENYDAAILGFAVPHDGVYTLRVTAAVDGQYGIVLTDSLVFDSEPNGQLIDPIRSLDGVGTALGFLGTPGATGGGTPLLFCAEWQDPTPVPIHAVDPATGNILATFDAPVTPSTNPFGLNLAFDGTNLYFNAGSFGGDNTIYVLDAQDGTVLNSFVATASYSVLGLGYLGGQLFVMDDTEGDIDVYDAQTGAEVRSMIAPTWALTGFTGDDAHNLLYGVDQLDHTLLQIDPLTGSVLASAPSGLLSEQGMAVLGDELFVSETGGQGAPQQDIVVYDAATLTEIRRLAMPISTMIAGLGGDGVPASFTPAGAVRASDDPQDALDDGSGDLYDLWLSAGETVVITTQTPTVSPANWLDPALMLLDSGELLVNGGFETGDFTGWTATSNGPLELTPWTVGPAGGGFFFDSAPLGGMYSAYNGFDGTAGLEYQLYQDVAIPAGGGATLTTNHRIEHGGGGVGTLDRSLTITVRDTANNLLETLYTEEISVRGEPADLGWNQQVFDLSAYAGQTVRVHVSEFIPETFDSPAVIEFDDFNLRSSAPLATDHDTEDGRNARLVFTAPRTGVYTIAVLPEEGGGEYVLGTEIFTEPMPLIRVDDVAVVEGDSGTVQAVVAVSLSEAPTGPVTVQLDTHDDTAMVADNDYQPVNDLVLDFQPGDDLTQYVVVQVNGDATIEPREAFRARLTGAAGAIIADPLCVATILNDDTAITITHELELIEADDGVTAYEFTLSLVAPADVPVTVDYTTADDTAMAGDLDYVPLAGTVTFEPNELERTITVEVLSDTQIEDHETFLLNFSNPSQPIDDLQSIGTILNDDTEILIDDVVQDEGNGGTTAFEFTVSLAAPSAVPVFVEVSTADGSAAVKDGDYVPIDGLELTFEPEQTVQTVTVDVVADARHEQDETFRVVLNHASQPMARSRAIGTILNDDTEVLGRHIFYNRSSFDDYDRRLNEADDNAIAVDKEALLPGQKASFRNYTSYYLGINGIMVDIAGPAYSLTLADFRFHVGNNDDPSTWLPAPDPSTFALREGAGVGGSDRVTIVWDGLAITREWLQVTVLANEITALPADDVFYFGNTVGEAGNSPLNAQVTSTDILLARNNPRMFMAPASIDFPYDYNRDQRVNATDMLLARTNCTNFLNWLELIDLSQTDDPTSAPSAAAAVGTDRALAELAWLGEFELNSWGKRTSRTIAPIVQAVDLLLAEES